jgi:hypothetical protein
VSGARYPTYDEEQGCYVCSYCDRPLLMQHPDDERTLVCVVDGIRFDTPTDGEWTFSEAAGGSSG